MRRSLLALTVAILLIARVPLHADLLVYGLFGDYVEALRAQAGIPGLSAVIVGVDDILWERASGQQNVERAIAARTDTPYQLDGITQVFMASVVLRCVEDGYVTLDNSLGQFNPTNPDASATIRQILTHTSGTATSPSFAYHPERFNSLVDIVSVCTRGSFRATVASGLDRFAMVDSVPGLDAVDVVPPTDGISNQAVVRYGAALQRLATPYVVDQQKHATPSQYAVRTLTGSRGLVSTARDYARFDLALRKGVLLRPETLAAAWRAPVDGNGVPLPHGMGWFVQTYNGEKVVWQFGVSDNASSSLVVTVPSRGLTLILLANSDGLVKSFPLAAGDVTASPFAKVFLGIFVR
ncbi:MAG: beta-lactamase family protein [Acidobacteria bacterium]|nr:beta-lactamase family protein [Acidobacteriota bacterium]